MSAAVAQGGSVHPNLQNLNSLHLTYPGFERDKKEAEAVLKGDSSVSLGFDAAMRRLKVKQRAHEEQKSMQAIHRSHPNLVSLDALQLTYPNWQQDLQQAESAHNADPNCDFTEVLRKIQVKQYRSENDRSHYRMREIDSLKLSYPGWKADIRNLEKFHFEEAFFLPGDSLFQSKLDGLKRRQQIYLRSQRVRANRMGHAQSEDHEEEVMVVISAPEKPSYTTLTETKSESNLHYLPCVASSSAVDEERTDRQYTRAPYAVILDADSVATESSRTQVDLPLRPDPPECDSSQVEFRSASRQSVDCAEQSAEVWGSVDCEKRVSVKDSRDDRQETKSDPQGMSGEEQASKSMQQGTWPSRLSSYVDLAPISEPESNEGGTSEEVDEVKKLQTRKSAQHRHRRNRRLIKPKGIYSAPPMPISEEDEISIASRACSTVTNSSSRAVFISDRSMSVGSQATSTRAVFSDEMSAESATSSRAVWAESPNPYLTQTPSSIRPVLSIPDTPRERSHTQQLKSKGSTSDRLRKTGRSSEDRSRRCAGEERSRASRSSKASSKNSSIGSSRSRKLGRCTICGDPDKNHVFVPCGHLCACKLCAEEVIARKMTCPVCRGKVTEAIQVFL